MEPKYCNSVARHPSKMCAKSSESASWASDRPLEYRMGETIAEIASEETDEHRVIGLPWLYRSDCRPWYQRVTKAYVTDDTMDGGLAGKTR